MSKYLFVDVTLPRLKAFISQLLSRLHIEALLHGNITKQVGFDMLLNRGRFILITIQNQEFALGSFLNHMHWFVL